jgi:hypothetical protein
MNITVDAGGSMAESAARCLHNILDDGVHEFVMLEFSRAGVDAFAAALQEMNASLPPGTLAPVLVDSSQGTQPVSYMFTRMRELNKVAPKSKTRSRVALLHKPGIIATITDGMMGIFPQVRVRIFSPEHRDVALQWLAERA